MSDMANSWIGNMRIEEYGTAIQMLDTTSVSFYNHVQDVQIFNCNNGVSLGGTQPNLNLWTNVRVRQKAGGAGTGFNLVDTRGNVFVMPDAEPATAAGITGFHLDGTTRDNLFLGMWAENNATGLLIDAGANNNVFIGGSITSNSTDITDNGTGTIMLGVNKTGTKINRINKFTDILGNEVLKFTETASAVNEITIANAATTGNPVISATGDDSNVSLSLIPKGTGLIQVTAQGNTSTSVSIGGVLNVNNTNSTGAGLVVYSNNATATGRLFSAVADNTGFATQVAYFQQDGTSHAVSIVQNSTGSSANALTLVSVNPNDTTLGISGEETGKGTVKITHTGTGTDGNASAISIQLAGAGTASQGIFMDSTGATTGKLLNLRNNGTEFLTLSSAGFLGLTTATPNSTLNINGSVATAYRAITALRTLDSTDYFIDCTANTFTVTLPTAVGVTGRTYIIKNSGTGVITIDGNGTETIDGALTQVLGTQYDFYRITSDGANWKITG